MSNKCYFGSQKEGKNGSLAYIELVWALYNAEIRVMILKSDFIIPMTKSDLQHTGVYPGTQKYRNPLFPLAFQQ
jgi:hypothetical protein